MKLCVNNRAGQKMHINVQATTRTDLRIRFNGDWFTINDGNIYNVNEVYAEADAPVPNTAAGAVLGGLVGLLGGPLGIIIGAGLGGILGNASDNADIQRVNLFNASR